MARLTTYFILAVFIGSLIKGLLVPTLLFDGQFWAEAGTNYWYQTQFNTFFSSLAVDDSGYLPFLSRLIAWCFQLLNLSLSQTAFVYQAFSLFFVNAICFLFVLPFFRKVLKSDSVRGLVSLGLFFHFDYELHQFINFGYYLAIPFFIYLLSFKKWKTANFSEVLFFSIALLLAGLSKAIFLAFGPLIVWVILKDLKTINRSHIPFLFALIGIGLQTLFTMTHKFPANNNNTLLSGLGFTWTFMSSFIGAFIFTFQGAKGAIGIISFLSLIWFFKKHKAWEELRSPFFIQVSIITSVVIGLTLFSKYDHLEETFPHIKQNTIGIRWFFLPVVGFYLALAFHWFESKKISETALKQGWALMLLGSFVFTPARLLDRPTWPTIGYSNLQSFESDFKDLKNLTLEQRKSKSLCIPINPYPWMVLNNCTSLVEIPNLEKISESPTSLFSSINFEINKLEAATVNTVGSNYISISGRFKTFGFFVKDTSKLNTHLETEFKISFLNSSGAVESMALKPAHVIINSGLLVFNLPQDMRPTKIEFLKPLNLRMNMANNQPIILAFGSKN